MPERSLSNRIWYWLVKRTIQLLWVIIYGVRSSGTGNIPSEGGVLLISNHQSHFDPPLVGSCCPRRVNYMAKKGLFHFAPLAWWIMALGAFPIDREGSPLGGIKEAMRRLKHGEVILMFPEGSRSFDGKIGKLMNGFTMIAVRTKSAIVPVAIEGAFQAWPRTQKFPRNGPRLHVMFGEPILPEDFPKYNGEELAEEVQSRMRQCHRRVSEHPDFSGHNLG